MPHPEGTTPVTPLPETRPFPLQIDAAASKTEEEISTQALRVLTQSISWSSQRTDRGAPLARSGERSPRATITFIPTNPPAEERTGYATTPLSIPQTSLLAQEDLRTMADSAAQGRESSRPEQTIGTTKDSPAARSNPGQKISDADIRRTEGLKVLSLKPEEEFIRRKKEEEAFNAQMSTAFQLAEQADYPNVYPTQLCVPDRADQPIPDSTDTAIDFETVYRTIEMRNDLEKKSTKQQEEKSALEEQSIDGRSALINEELLENALLEEQARDALKVAETKESIIRIMNVAFPVIFLLVKGISFLSLK